MLLYLFVHADSLFLSLLFQLLLPLTSPSKKNKNLTSVSSPTLKKNLLISLNLHVTALRSVKNDVIIAPGDI